MSTNRIAFYIGLKNSKKTLECADLDLGNPGVGGTQYLFLLTVKYLNRLYGKGYAVLLTDGNCGLNDSEIDINYVGDERGAVQYCENNSIPVLTFNANIADRVGNEVFDTSVRLFLWAHNTLTGKRQNIAAKTTSIDRVICVSESQYKNMKDTPCYHKCTFINNIIPKYFYDNSTLTNYSEEKAVYVGSVMPQKGVHNLLEIWKYVEQRAPKAQLYIFGGANVWNSNTRLGSRGTADEYYDRVIYRRMKRLKHPENIHFMGARGWKEINGMISTARVGVVNPSHYMRDETFCMSAIEMEAHGIPVVSRQRNDGLNTTIIHKKTGFLEGKNADIANRIVSLIKDNNLCSKMGMTAREEAKNFIVENEVTKWHDIAESERIEVKSVSASGQKSKDAKLLQHDFVLKLMFLVESGKFIDLIIKKIKWR
jgi:glycosyltransferase involved in cell wall biosynthesis